MEHSRQDPKPPFDASLLDALMDEAGLDFVLMTSKHSVQYAFGGYRYFFHSYMDAHGLSRYLPFFVYKRGNLDAAAFIGSPMESYENELGSFWVANTSFESMTSTQYASSAAEHLQRIGADGSCIGVEIGFLPADAYLALSRLLPEARIVDATLQVELLRAVKSETELAYLKAASDKVVESISRVFESFGPGSTKREIVGALKAEEQSRGLDFEYGLCNFGTDFNRAPSDRVWLDGEVLCLDSGGNYKGYIGDLARMKFPGEPDGELEELLGFVEEVQQAARKPIRDGALGREIFERPLEMIGGSPWSEYTEFLAHGMGIVSHEPPWLTDAGPVPYAAYHAGKPLRAGMVLSVETTMSHPVRGFIKIEDTIAVTDDGYEAFGDHGRGWN
ncbi:MAG: Xaa-Pro peptidase family protein [Albidovulum sp.]|nr:Xaa-Pro peptidase family protein [Albidovulum sp.]